MKHYRLKRKVLVIAGGLLIGSSLVFAAHNLYLSHHAGQKAEEAYTALIQSTPLPAAQTEEIDNTEREMPVMMVGNELYVGTVSIPSLDLNLPVQRDWREENTGFTPARFTGSVYKDNMVLCAHNYRTHFGRLNELQEGDTVEFRDTENNLYTYRVIRSEILDGNAVEEMITGDWDLTLFTCTTDALRRVTIRCERIDNP